jgi:hypothetical protein
MSIAVVSEELPGAEHEPIWDGRDDRGASVSSEIYFVVVQAPDRRAVKKLVISK